MAAPSSLLRSYPVPRYPYLTRRQTSSSTPADLGSGQVVLIVVIGLVFGLIGIVGACILVKRYRVTRDRNNSTKSRSKSSFLGRWRSNSTRGEYSASLQPSTTNSTGNNESLSRERSVDHSRDLEMELAGRNDQSSTTNNNNNDNANEGGVDRHASVRSIMTLPPYSVSARPTEQVLGREGDRAGVDVVVEQPETVNEEEERREEEMESLYQIRHARREEASEREQRRRARREARARGDLSTVARLQEESRARAEAAADGLLVSSQLIAEHQTKNRDRRVSAVQYHDLGLARHDGSRLRATSVDSDNRPLLDSAASISGRPESVALSTASRNRDSSIRSTSPRGSVDNRISADFEVLSLDNRSRSPSISPSINAPAEDPMSLVQSSFTGGSAERPPNYEHLAWGEAPPYESPIARHAPQLPLPAAVPAIEITVARSPTERRSPTVPRPAYSH